MPRVTLSLRRLNERLSTPLDRARLGDLLAFSKAQLEGGLDDELLIEGTADRLDLLTEGGLAVHLQGVTKSALGPLASLAAPTHPLTIEVDASVRPLRPEIRGVVVSPPSGASLSAELLQEAIRFQELLHSTLGLDRRLASLGIYPIERIHGPVRYAMEPLEQVRFTPLEATGEMDGATFFGSHPMSDRYGSLGSAHGRCLVLRDGAGTILSLPPVLNSREAGEARPGDGAMLIESTGTRASRVADCVSLLALVFRASGWSWADVPARFGELAVEAPALTAGRSLALSHRTFQALAGESLTSDAVMELLHQARFGATAHREGWTVSVPAYRPDVLAEADLVEDVLMARGFRPEEGIVPASATRGHRSREARFRARIADLLLGLGFVPLYSPVLVGATTVELAGRTGAIALANPVSDQFSHLRDSMLLPLLRALEHNVRHGYPQRLSELGPVVVRSSSADTGAETRYRAGVLIAQEGAGFSDGAALVDRVIRACGALGIREPAELPGTIPGRAAVVRLAGEVVAEIGEVHPKVLHALHVPVPVVWADVDLTALQTLTGPAR